VSEQIIKLNDVLDETSQELNRLKTEIAGFGSTLENASERIDSSVTAMSISVNNIEEASVQLNSLLFPIVGSIAIIVALQIVILSRRGGFRNIQ
jgi:archaellum component FlaC